MQVPVRLAPDGRLDPGGQYKQMHGPHCPTPGEAAVGYDLGILFRTLKVRRLDPVCTP